MAAHRTATGRDGCRVPIPWSGDAPPYGFGPGTGQPWLPQPLDWADRSVAAQEQDPDSTLAFYKAALAARRKHTRDTTEDVELLARGSATCSPSRRGELTVVLNAGTDAAELPAGDVVVASGDLVGRLLPADTAVWLVNPA